MSDTLSITHFTVAGYIILQNQEVTLTHTLMRTCKHMHSQPAAIFKTVLWMNWGKQREMDQK